VSVIAELKRRNVFRVAALYLVAAWVLLQVGDLLFGLLSLPTRTNKLTVRRARARFRSSSDCSSPRSSS